MADIHISTGKDDSVEGMARDYVRNIKAIREFNSWYWHATRRLKEYVRDIGPLRIDGQTVKLTNGDPEWDEVAVVTAFPGLCTLQITVPLDNELDVERAIDLLEEQFPYTNGQITSKVKVDKRLVTSAIENLQPERVLELLKLKKPGGSITVA